MKTKLLDVKQIINILLDEKVVFICKVCDLGQDIDYDILEFTLCEGYNDCCFCVDTYIHKANILLNDNYYTIYTKEQFLGLINSVILSDCNIF